MHHHDHTHSRRQTRVNKAFIWGIVLNTAFVIIEVIFGFTNHSLGLLSDAGHNLSDIASLAVAMFAFRIARVPVSQKFTYGYSKSTILASLLNSVLLFAAIAAIGYEAVQRFLHPVSTNGSVISIVAAVGVFINGLSAWLFFNDKGKDLNVKSAYVHMLADALVSLGVVVAGLVIYYTGWQLADPVISLVIMGTLFYNAFGMLRESLFLSLDATPYDIDVEEIKNKALDIPGVIDIHHIHVWAMSTTRNALTAHLTLEEKTNEADRIRIKNQLKHQLAHLNIQHATLETEQEICKEAACESESH